MKYRTFTHGDPKQANLLFRQSSNALQVGLIDFQWSGFGLAATDIAHFMTSGVHADMLVDGGEECLLKYYFDELQKYLVEFGAYKDADDALQNYSYDTFTEQYEIGVLDICRLMIAYTWSRFEFPVKKDDVEGCALTMNKTSYNKSIPTIIWLLNRCDEILKSRGV
jgi:thiamine kinase-like enzyme